MVYDFDVVYEADEEVWVEFLDLVEVEGAEEAMAPAEGGVGVDDDVLFVFGVCDDVFEGCASE